MTRSGLHRLLEACLWMAPVFGPLPAEILVHRYRTDDEEPAPLSRAEQLQWAAMVEELD